MDVGVVVALGLLAGVMIAAWVLSRKSRDETEYDERQLKIRAKGFQIGFYTVLFLLLVLILLQELDCLTMVTPGFATFAVLLVSVVVFAIYCITHDAFVSVRGNARTYILLFSGIALLDAVVTIRRLSEGSFLENGRVTFSGGSNALACLGFLAILLALIAKTIRERKEASE